MLTEKEQAVLDCLAEAWNKFVELPVVHEWDNDEFMRAIHAAQKIVMARPVIWSLSKEDSTG